MVFRYTTTSLNRGHGWSLAHSETCGGASNIQVADALTTRSTKGV
jgi:hypothetical protein